MNTKVLKNDALLLTTAIIWGLSFAAQRVGMEYIGPFTFNGIRFLLGALSITPVILILSRGKEKENPKLVLLYGTIAGVFLFAGASLQQMGIVHTTAGKAGFITGIYVVIVPFMGILLNHKSGKSRWFGAVLSITGLYFLSIRGSFHIDKGDYLVLTGAFFWAAHVVAMGIMSPRVNPLKLAVIQYFVCGILSLAAAFGLENVMINTISLAWLPIFYGGLFSVGVAYTLQIIAQKEAHPAHAAIILSLEGVFAVVGGWLFLSETMDFRSIFGCILMLGGMFVSQADAIKKRK